MKDPYTHPSGEIDPPSTRRDGLNENPDGSYAYGNQLLSEAREEEGKDKKTEEDHDKIKIKLEEVQKNIEKVKIELDQN